jgi:plasmid maintenance system killer protein
MSKVQERRKELINIIEAKNKIETKSNIQSGDLVNKVNSIQKMVVIHINNGYCICEYLNNTINLEIQKLDDLEII